MTRGFLETAVEAAKEAGQLILEGLGQLSKEDVNKKQAFDYVTTVDRAAQKSIVSAIRKTYPGHTFLAEEELEEGEAEYRWIIDPLDGTTNYIHGYPHFAVSIALEHEKEIIMGVIYDPLKKELFTALRGRGAYLNGRAIHVREPEDLGQALIATGFPFRDKEQIDSYLEVFRDLFLRASDIRRAGSAVLDLAYLASGRCDGFYEIRLFPWDLAAGGLIIEEAGGVVTDFAGGGDYIWTGNIVAGTPEVHRELLEAVQKVFKGVIDR